MGQIYMGRNESKVESIIFIQKQVLLIARGQRQLMHQLDNLSNLLRDYVTEKGIDRADKTSKFTEIESFGVPVIAALAIGGLGFLLCRTLYSQK